MKITAIDIIGYGKWIDTHFHHLKTTQLFFGANEAGKSTIMAFIHSMLFGFPTKQQSIPRLEPKNGGAYGGRLTLSETKFGTVVIERLKGKASGDVTVYLEDGSIYGETKLIELLEEMDRSTYEAIFSFDIHALQNIQQWKQADFERYLLVTSTTGSDLLLKAMTRLQKELDKRFKPGGRNPLINKQLEKVKLANSQFEEAKLQNANYKALYQEKQELETKQEASLTEQKSLKLEVSQKKAWLEYWESYQEWRNLTAYLADKEQIHLPIDGRIRLEHLKEKLEENKNRQIQFQERYEQLLNQKEQVDDSFFEVNQDELLTITETYPLYQENKQQLAIKKKEIEEIITFMKKQSFSVDEELLTENWRDDLLEKIESEERKIEESKQQQQRLHYLLEEEAIKQTEQQAQIDHLETEMWSRQKLQTAEQHREESQTSKNNRFKWWIPLSLLGTSGIITLLFPSKITLALFIIIVLGNIGWFFRKRAASSNINEQAIMELMEQRQKHQMWQKLLTELDASQAKRAAWDDNYQEQVAASKHSELQTRQTLQTLGIPVEAVQQRFYPFFLQLQTIVDKIKRKQFLESECQMLEEALLNWQTKCNRLSPSPPFQAKTTEEWVALLKQGMRKYQDTIASKTKQIDKMEQVESELALLRRDEETLKKRKIELLEKASVTDEEEFRRRYEEAAEIHKNNERKHFLEMQSEPHVRQALQNYDSKELLKAELVDLDMKIVQISEQQEHRHAELARVNHEIQLLEAGGTFANLMQTFYTEKTELQRVVKEWMTIKLSLEILKRTLEKLQRDKLPQALKLASHYFAKLTKGHYQHVRFTDDRLQVETNDRVFFFPEELSQATKEQLYLAVRFAFIDILHKKYPLPIIIDDSFVNFDKERLAEMMDLLKMRQGKNQILLFSCHETSLDYFSSIERVVLY